MRDELRQLDADIAEKVMGWTRYTDYDYSPPQAEWREQGQFRAIVNCAGQLENLPLWSPSSDISAAMEVVEKMRGCDLMPRLWAAQLWNVEFWRMDVDTCVASWSGFSLPEAICRAALAAVNESSQSQ